MNYDTVFRTNALLLHAFPPLVFSFAFNIMAVINVPLSFCKKKKNACFARYALSATSGFWIHHLSVSLNKNLMCHMHLLMSCGFPVKYEACCSLTHAKKLISEFLLWAVDHQSNDGF